MRSPEVAFRLESTTVGAEQMSALAEAFPSADESVQALDSTYFDTFDWRIFADGGVIVRSGGAGGRVEWRRGSGRPLRLPGKKPPAFADDLPAGEIREALSSVIEVRRLLPMVRVTGSGRGLRILNSDRKTVVRARLEERRAAAGRGSRRWRPMPFLLRLVPVRGYERERRRVESFLAERLGSPGRPPSELETALEAIGAEAGSYSSKLAIRLSPEANGGEAARRIHRALLETLEANEPGLREDLDIEFLHDFRVAVRRTRTALAQIRDVFPAAALRHFKREFSWLGDLTGASRDLDVFLQRMAGYRASLPDSARSELAPLETLVRRRRAAQRRRVNRGLDSARCRRLIADWRRFLEDEAADGEGEIPADASRPAREVADRNIRRAHRRVLKRGGKIDDQSPPSSLHRLRIDCKKLRYLLEFFRSLYPAREIGRVISELKRLQDNLGDFNDYAVQQQMLESLAAALARKGPPPVGTLMAVGRLVAHLEEGEAAERRGFAAKFARFSSPKSRRLFERLLASDAAAGGAE